MLLTPILLRWPKREEISDTLYCKHMIDKRIGDAMERARRTRKRVIGRLPKAVDSSDVQSRPDDDFTVTESTDKAELVNRARMEYQERMTDPNSTATHEEILSDVVEMY